MPTDPTDSWAIGAAYEPYVGRWSRLVAREFVRWLDLPAGKHWVDVGCGTGALTATVIELASPAHVEGVDPSAGYLAHARAHLEPAGVRFHQADARRLPQPGASADVVVSGLALNFVPQPDAAVAEMARIVCPGGTVAAYLWDYAGRMELMRYFWDAAAELDPMAADLDEGRRFPLCAPAPLAKLFDRAALSAVETHSIDVPTVFREFDDYWSPFLGGQGPAPSYLMGLSEDRRALLRERLRGGLPTSADGSIALVARAWAVRGTRPPA